MQYKYKIIAFAGLLALLSVAPRKAAADEFKPLMLQSQPALPVGSALPVLNALDDSGKPVLLCGGAAKWTVVVFLSTRCACTARYLERLEAVGKAFAAQSVQIVGVNSNANEQARDVKMFAKAQALPFPLLKDADDSVAFALRPRATPEVFVLDASRVIRYHGAIDDSLYGDNVKKFYLHDALTALTTGKTPAKTDIPVMGCGIFVPKRK